MSDPYALLHLTPDATRKEIDRAFYYMSKIHPEGHPFSLKLQKAYHDILQQRQQYQFNPEEISASINNTKAGTRTVPNFAYNIDESKFNRDKQSYEREYAEITAQAERITPMFDKANFDNNTFNHVFDHLKNQHKGSETNNDLTPKPLMSNGTVACTNLTAKKGKTRGLNVGLTANINQAYDMHTNPDSFSEDFINSFKNKPSITSESALSRSEIKNRIDKYHSEDTNFHTQTPSASASGLTHEALREEQLNIYRNEQAQRTKNNLDNYQRIMDLRQPYIPFRDHTTMVERPQVDRHVQQQVQPQFQLQNQFHTQAQTQAQPPPIYKKSHLVARHKDKTYTEIQKLKKQLKQQEKIIKRLQSNMDHPRL